MIDLLEMMNKIKNLEASIDVGSWSIDGVHVWPVFRSVLRAKMLANNGVASYQPGRKNILHFASVVMKFSKILRKIKTLSNVEILLLGDGYSFVKFGDQYYDRVLYPFLDYFNASHKSCLYIEQSFQFPYPRKYPSYFVQPVLAIYALISKNTLKRGEFNDLGSLYQFAIRENLDFEEKDFESILRSFELGLHVSRRIIKKTRPKVVLVSDYYSGLGMMFTAAANLEEIPTIEVQHGVINDSHLMYSGFSHQIYGGFNTLPKYYWCWGNAEAETINEWGAAYGRIAWPAGNLFFREWEKLGVKKTKMSKNRSLQIFVSLQPISRSECLTSELKVLMETLENKDIVWNLRLHPTMIKNLDVWTSEVLLYKQKKPKINLRLDSFFEKDLFTNILENDVHVTHSSATAFEASLLNIKTFVISTYGCQMLSSLIKNKEAFFIGNRLNDPSVFEYMKKIIEEKKDAVEMKTAKFNYYLNIIDSMIK